MCCRMSNMFRNYLWLPNGWRDIEEMFGNMITGLMCRIFFGFCEQFWLQYLLESILNTVQVLYLFTLFSVIISIR